MRSVMQRCAVWAAVALFLLTTGGVEGQTPQVTGPTVSAFLFGDALFDLRDADEPDGFQLGQMVAHANGALSDRVFFFGEVSVTARNNGYSLAMERAILRYDFGDRVKVSAGRYHTPVSYWNTQYHHGLWLQGSVARPEAIKFGSRYIPVHVVGAAVEGSLRAVPLHYVAGIANGRGDNIAAAGDAGDVNGNRAVFGSLSIRPRTLLGASVGGGVYVDRISSGGVEFSDEIIGTAHVVWDRGAVQAIAEFIHVRHEPVDGGSSTGSPSFYVHLGYELDGRARGITPYVRYEEIDIDDDDPVFAGQLEDYEAVVVGVRYDFDALAALKAEYRNEQVGGGDRLDSYYVQASFAIPVAGGS